MIFYDILEEAITNDMNGFLELVKRDCQPYLQQNSSPLVDTPMWRGLKNPMEETIIAKKGPFQKRDVRLTDRKPKDTPKAIHDALNYAFVKDYGAEFRNALFVTNDMYQAGGYGALYIIFPRGNFTFLWSPDIPDIFTHYENKQTKQSDEDFVLDLLNNNDYSTNNLQEAIKSTNEIMIRCNSYYALRVRHLSNSQLQGIQLIINL